MRISRLRPLLFPVLAAAVHLCSPSNAVSVELVPETLARALDTPWALDPKDARKAQSFERRLARQFGRLRDIVEGPDKAIYLLTSNRDGRGSPAPDDDRLIRLSIKS